MQGYHQRPHHAPGVHRARRGGALHEGVHSFMNGVYAWMAAGFALTAAVAWFISSSPAAVMAIHLSPMRWLFYLAPLGLSMFAFPRIPSMDRGIAIGLFAVYAACIGVWFSVIPLIYNVGSILAVLGATIGMFAAMALVGMFTKRDLSGMGQFLIMALFGAVIASLINVVFLHHVGTSLLISGVVAVVAAGLTAYHTQQIRQFYLANGAQGNIAILGALLLYVDFVNLFVSLLHLFGGSRD